MAEILFPNWIIFAGILFFLKIFNPFRLYIDNTVANSIAIMMAMALDSFYTEQSFTFLWLLNVVIFSFFMSVPYWLGGMVGSIIQQLLLLNEQSVQDQRFTDESEALSVISSTLFLMYALTTGYLFYPFVELINNTFELRWEITFESLYNLITDSMKMMFVVAGKYIILLLTVTICSGYIDLFFKKASLSTFVTPNIKSIMIMFLLNIWFFHDIEYVFTEMMEKMGYG